MSEDVHCRYVPAQLGPIVCQPTHDDSPSAGQSIAVMRWAASRLAICEDIHCRCVATQLGTIICQPIYNGTSSAVQSIDVMRWCRCVEAEPCRGWQFLMTFIVAVWPPSWGPSSASLPTMAVSLQCKALL